LGSGGFGITYLAENTKVTGLLVAIKEFFPATAYRDNPSRNIYSSNEELQEEYQLGLRRFQKEAQMLAKFKHHNIVRVFDYFDVYGNGL